MKILIFLTLLLLSFSYKFKKSMSISYPQRFSQVVTKNPDQVAGGSGGGDNGEFLRRNQPQEHIIVPLINSLEAEYVFAPDIRKYRKSLTKTDKGIEFRLKINKEMNQQFYKIFNK